MNPECEMLANRPYSVKVVPDKCTDATICYLASNPELPGCMSHGDTVQEALENLAEARRLYIEMLLRKGLPVPEPRAVISATGTTATSIIWQLLMVTPQVPGAEPIVIEGIFSGERRTKR